MADDVDADAEADQMDDRIDAWVLEFLLRQPCVDIAAAASLLTTLPVPNDDAVRLAILLQALRCEISLPSLSKRTLALIESFLAVHGGSGGADILASAWTAYRALVVEAVAKHLREEPPDIEGFLLDVERVWKKRGERFAARWLVWEELMELKRELLAAIGNEVVRDGLLRRDTKAVAVKAVGAFLEAAERELGPPFLVSLSGAMVDNLFRMDDEFISSVMAEASNNNDTLLSSESEKEYEVLPRTDGVAKDMDHVDEKSDPSLAAKTLAKGNPASMSTFSQYDPLSVGEIKITLEELTSNAKDLKSVADDLLPVLIGIAENMVKQHIAGQPSHLGEFRLSSDGHEGIASLKASVENVNEASTSANKIQTHQSAISRTKFDESNPTAQTYQWSDNSSTKDSPPREVPLPSPRKLVNSPLKSRDEKKFKRKRMPKRWSALEEDALRAGVREYGRGNWKLILKKNHEIFVDRTEIDLKDKWRNMLR